MPTPIPAQPLNRLTCPGCGWTLAILAQTDTPISKCPWCGNNEFNDQPPTHSGAGQMLECKRHGTVVVQVLDKGIETEDFLDNLYCPFCP
ncbi:hypothetical protein [Pseudomonas sp. UBA6562]|uniref:hypothetical protein n=1 Tax=Pseudomonas sp. UBA6562 TaxID=1947332 RepID=UPI0025CC8E71|nr:hypothetical protein [Pseudomonas sp. UBA6562]